MANFPPEKQLTTQIPVNSVWNDHTPKKFLDSQQPQYYSEQFFLIFKFIKKKKDAIAFLHPFLCYCWYLTCCVSLMAVFVSSLVNYLLRQSLCVSLCVCLLSPLWFFATPWTVACQPSLSVGFPRQEYWSGLPFPPPGDLPIPGIKPMSLVSSADGFFNTASPRKSLLCLNSLYAIFMS